MAFSGKRVLLLSPTFFGYDQEIARELRLMGAEVDVFDTRPSNDLLTKVALRLTPALVVEKARAYHRKLLTASSDYDYVLVIRGEGLTPEIVGAYRQRFTAAKFVYYSYDAASENPLILVFKEMFDRCYSFDPTDVKKYSNLIYEPLFYIRKYGKIGNLNLSDRRFDLSFVGTFRADRYKSIQNIVQFLPKNLKTYYYFFHPSQKIFQTLKLLSRAYQNIDSSLIHFKSISPQRISEILEQSKAVIDVQKSHQTGLTMRTIETLGASRKLITTNANVKNHDFYNPNNIHVFDPLHPVIPEDFFEQPYQPPAHQILERYSLESWLKRVLQ